VAVGAEHDVVRGEAVGGDEEAEVALDDEALVVGQPARVLPQLDVALHVDLLRHPVVRAAREVLLPRPAVLERHELVDVGRAVDDALVLDAHALGAAVRHLLLDVEVLHRLAAREDAARDLRPDRLGGARRELRDGRGGQVVVEGEGLHVGVSPGVAVGL